MNRFVKSALTCLLTATTVIAVGGASVSAAAETEPERHVLYSFSFDEPDATTLYKKAGATPGYISHDVFAGESGGSLALTISPAELTGRGGVLPYIWPDGISGVFNNLGDLGEGEYYELKVDIAWDGGVAVAKKGAYVYPFILTNGKDENYFTADQETVTKQIGPEFQTFTYQLFKISPDGYQEFAPPERGSDSGGIAFCCENSLRTGKTLYIDNIEFAKVGGDFTEPEEGTIRYVTPVEAPTTYEPMDENGKTVDGKQMTMLYENDFEDASKGTVFGHWNPDISKAFILDTKKGYRNNDTMVGSYLIPKLSPGKFFSETGYYPVIWFWNEELRDIYKQQAPLGDGDYYVFQFDTVAKGSYVYPSLMVGDKEYAPTYEWDSTGRVGSEAVQPFNSVFVTRYYVFKVKGLDLASGNTAFALFTDGYTNQHVPVYVDNFKFYSVRGGLCGDANNDGAVNMKDVLVLRQSLTGMAVELNDRNADANADGAVNLKDVLALRLYLVGAEKSLPVKAS